MPVDKIKTATERVAPAVERHFQSIVSAILLGVLAWVGNNLQQASLDIAALTVKMENMQAQLQATSQDAYRDGDATRDFALRDQRIESLAAVVREQGARISNLEADR